MKKVIITGSAGFLGFHLSEYFLKLDYEVIGIDNFISSDDFNNKLLLGRYENYRFISANVCDCWNELGWGDLNNLEYVFYLASPASPKFYNMYPFETMSANTQGLLNALKFATTQNARLIFTSSSEIYGYSVKIPQNESDVGMTHSFKDRSCYPDAKRMGESIVYEFNRLNQTSHGLVRLFNSYGPNMSLEDGRVIINFFVESLKSGKMTINGDGEQTRSFCYVNDTIQGIVAYAKSDLSIPVNIGNNHEISISNLALNINKNFFNEKSKIIYSNYFVYEPTRRCPDISLAKQKLNWYPQVDLQKGLKDTFDWVNYRLESQNDELRS